jgi:hypothetical protein
LGVDLMLLTEWSRKGNTLLYCTGVEAKEFVDNHGHAMR